MDIHNYERTCPACEGAGHDRALDVCLTCHGEGTVTTTEQKPCRVCGQPTTHTLKSGVEHVHPDCMGTWRGALDLRKQLAQTYSEAQATAHVDALLVQTRMLVKPAYEWTGNQPCPLCLDPATPRMDCKGCQGAGSVPSIEIKHSTETGEPLLHVLKREPDGRLIGASCEHCSRYQWEEVIRYKAAPQLPGGQGRVRAPSVEVKCQCRHVQHWYTDQLLAVGWGTLDQTRPPYLTPRQLPASRDKTMRSTVVPIGRLRTTPGAPARRHSSVLTPKIPTINMLDRSTYFDSQGTIRVTRRKEPGEGIDGGGAHVAYAHLYAGHGRPIAKTEQQGGLLWWRFDQPQQDWIGYLPIRGADAIICTIALGELLPLMGPGMTKVSGFDQIERAFIGTISAGLNAHSLRSEKAEAIEREEAAIEAARSRIIVETIDKLSITPASTDRFMGSVIAWVQSKTAPEMWHGRYYVSSADRALRHTNVIAVRFGPDDCAADLFATIESAIRLAISASGLTVGERDLTSIERAVFPKLQAGESLRSAQGYFEPDDQVAIRPTTWEHILKQPRAGYHPQLGEHARNVVGTVIRGSEGRYYVEHTSGIKQDWPGEALMLAADAEHVPALTDIGGGDYAVSDNDFAARLEAARRRG